MNGTGLIIVLTAIAAAIALVVYFRIRDDGVFRTLSWKNETRTPKGAKVVGHRKASSEDLDLIDRALDHAFAIARSHGYENFSLHPNYIVSLQRRSSACVHPGFLLETDWNPYDQGEYDKDPRAGKVRLCVGGKFELWGNPADAGDMRSYAKVLIVVDDPGVLFNAVWFEAEHAILLEVDPTKFNQTLHHTSGTGHPILAPRTAEAVSIDQPRKFSCGSASDIENYAKTP